MTAPGGSLAGLAADDLFEEVVVVPRRAYLPLADLRVIERPGWLQIITPSFTRGEFNGVARSVLDPDGADAIIDATIAEYRALGIRFRWTLDRQSAPVDLGARLERRGLAPREVVGVARATGKGPDTDASPQSGTQQEVSPSSAASGSEGGEAPSIADEPHAVPRGDGAITIERVDPASEPLYTAVMCAGWNQEPQAARVANAVALADPDRNRLYLARFQGEPAGVAASVMFERSVYLLGAVVLPAFRQRGVYRALVAARLADAAAGGRTLATSHARATTSAPLLARMGFVEVARLTVYEG